MQIFHDKIKTEFTTQHRRCKFLDAILLYSLTQIALVSQVLNELGSFTSLFFGETADFLVFCLQITEFFRNFVFRKWSSMV